MSQDNRSFRTGTLPPRAPLAAAYVPMQDGAEPTYDSDVSLARGTLFPGLDLPFMNVVNDSAPATPLRELMAIDFVADELELYLDTHPADMEAFTLYQSFLALQAEARRRYVERCGPLMQADMLGNGGYGWIAGPWPWEYRGGRGED